MAKTSVIDKEREKKIIYSYILKQEGKWKYSMLEIQNRFDLSAQRIHVILKRNGVKTRNSEK